MPPASTAAQLPFLNHCGKRRRQLFPTKKGRTGDGWQPDPAHFPLTWRSQTQSLAEAKVASCTAEPTATRGTAPATPRCCVLVLSTAVSSYYTQQNEVTSTDNLDFRHHSYKDMRQVGTAGGQIWHGLGSSVNKSMGVGSCVELEQPGLWDPSWW